MPKQKPLRGGQLAKTPCQLKVPPFYQCCCTCIYHRRIHHHCGNEPYPTREQMKAAGVKGPCVCAVQKGWACANPEMERIYDNWGEHSCGCECHTTKERAEEGNRHQRLASDLLFFAQYPAAPMFEGKRGKDMLKILNGALAKIK